MKLSTLLCGLLLIDTSVAPNSCYECKTCPVPFNPADPRVTLFDNCYDRACFSYQIDDVMQKGCLGERRCDNYRRTLSSHHGASEFYLFCCVGNRCNNDTAPLQGGLESYQVGLAVGGSILGLLVILLLCVFIFPRIRARFHASCCFCCLQRAEKM